MAKLNLSVAVGPYDRTRALVPLMCEHAPRLAPALAARLGGSVSGEHGIGLLKRGALARHRGFDAGKTQVKSSHCRASQLHGTVAFGLYLYVNCGQIAR